MNRSRFVFATVLFAAISLSGGVRAEGFVDLRVGGAFTDDGNVKQRVFGTTFNRFTAQFKDSVTGGVRGGYWFDSFPWLGVAADVSYFAPGDRDGDTDFDVIPVSPLLMARVPIARDEDYPGGRIQPFLGIGPGIFVSTIDDKPTGYKDLTVDVGVDLHAGMKYMVTPWLGLFAEYRFTSFEAQYRDTFLGVRVHTDVQFDTHHVAGGVAFHYF